MLYTIVQGSQPPERVASCLNSTRHRLQTEKSVSDEDKGQLPVTLLHERQGRGHRNVRVNTVLWPSVGLLLFQGKHLLCLPFLSSECVAVQRRECFRYVVLI